MMERLRAVVQDSLGKHLYENAIFFADKLVTLSGGEPDDVYRLAQAYVYTKQFRRALHVLHRSGQATASSRFRYLTAKCLAECQELDDCLTTLDDAALAAVAEETAAEGSGEGQVSMLSAMQLLKGSVYESQENWPLAARCYIAALHADCMCYEALDRLVANHMISTSEQQALLEELDPYLLAANAEWLRVYYRCKLEPNEGRQIAEAYARNDFNLSGEDEATGGDSARDNGEEEVEMPGVRALRDNWCVACPRPNHRSTPLPPMRCRRTCRGASLLRYQGSGHGQMQWLYAQPALSRPTQPRLTASRATWQ